MAAVRISALGAFAFYPRRAWMVYSATASPPLHHSTQERHSALALCGRHADPRRPARIARVEWRAWGARRADPPMQQRSRREPTAHECLATPLRDDRGPLSTLTDCLTAAPPRHAASQR